MNYYIVPIVYNEILLNWQPDVTILNYEARGYNIPALICKIKTPETVDNGTPITEQQYWED